MRFNRNIVRASAVAAAVVTCMSGPALAGFVGEGASPLSMTWDASMDAVDAFAFDPALVGSVEDVGNGTLRYTGGLENSLWEMSWDVKTPSGVQLDGSGFIDSSLTVTNLAATTQSFSLLMSLSVDPIGPASSLLGSTSASVTNNQSSGDAILQAPSGGSVYTALVDLAEVATLWDDPYSLTAVGPFATANDDTSFPATVGPQVNSSISVLLEFSLSAGDSATLSGVFDASKVPAPGAFALLAAAGLTRRRRRS